MERDSSKLFHQSEDLDPVDLRILGAVRGNARASNRQIAAVAGIAESTAHGRLRGLEARGVITGYEAVISQHSLGLDIHALVGVTLRPGARQASITHFSEEVCALPEVTQSFFIGGTDDFIIHVAVRDTSALRRFVVEHLSGHASVASTRTSIVFEYIRNAASASFN